MKRRRADSLTGGTGDVSPQLLSADITESAPNTFTSGSVTLPVNRFQLRAGRSIVVEILKVYWQLSDRDTADGVALTTKTIAAQLSTTALAQIDFTDPRVFAFCQKEYTGAFTAGGTFSVKSYEPFVQDLTDGAGHGFLVAVDQLQIAIASVGMTAARAAQVKILYRFKEITIEEYVGIVQGQQ